MWVDPIVGLPLSVATCQDGPAGWFCRVRKTHTPIKITTTTAAAIAANCGAQKNARREDGCNAVSDCSAASILLHISGGAVSRGSCCARFTPTLISSYCDRHCSHAITCSATSRLRSAASSALQYADKSFVT